VIQSAKKICRFREETQNEGYYGIQGHRDHCQSKVHMQLPISD